MRAGQNSELGCAGKLSENLPAEIMNPNTILWIYIVLLVAGGLVGFLKAGSKASIIASVSFAAALTLCAIDVIFQPHVADIILAVLLVVFGMRLSKSRKFMPNGLMLVLTLATLVLRHFKF
jgi:uncharacterized membrane protein (UPF0136 family)